MSKFFGARPKRFAQRNGQQDSRLDDLALHLWVNDVLVEHDTIENGALLQQAAWDLLNTSVSLDVDLSGRARGIETGLSLDGDGLHSFDCQVGDKIAESGHELGVESRSNQCQHLGVVVDIDTDASLLEHGKGVIKSSHIRLDDDTRVHVSLQEWGCLLHHIGCEDDDRSGAIANLLILSAAQLDHRLCCWVSHLDLSKNGVTMRNMRKMDHKG